MDFITPSPNKTMSRADFDIVQVREAADLIQETQRFVHANGLQYSHWCGQLDDTHLETTILNKGEGYEPLPWAYDDEAIPWFTLWEYAWPLANAGLGNSESCRILSLGGSSSSFEATLARLGHHVTVIEGRPHTAENARKNADTLGWDMDIRHGRIEHLDRILEGSEPFDFMVSTSVLFLCGQQAHEAVKKHLQRFIRPGGWAVFTFDFLNPNPARLVTDPITHFNYDNFEATAPFVDNGERYHLYYPEPSKGRYTAATLFLQRVSA